MTHCVRYGVPDPQGKERFGVELPANWWRFGLVYNVVGRINEVNQRRAWLVLGWVTVFKPSLYVTSHSDQLSLAIPRRVGKMSNGDD